MWITGVELPGETEIALPASLVYLVFPVPRAEDFFTAVTSNGLAAGPTLNAAVLSGLCELIERDALLITWMNKLPATEIEMPEQGFAGAAVLRHYARFGVEVRAFALHTDQLPTVVMAVATESDPARPARLVGMGCDLSPRVALDKAIFELCQGRPSEFIRFHQRPPAGRLKSYADVLTLDDHPAFHSLRENSSEFEFLWAAERKVALSAMPDHATGNADTALARCVDRLVATGHRAAYADITAPDVASAGYRVVRAFATGLQPIHFGWKEARLGGRRLFDAPVAWGLRDTPNSCESLNPCPHPLA
jgi:ribosomal protein S12 methylthiotransferase accessory factor